jgi:hypothetical protein
MHIKNIRFIKKVMFFIIILLVNYNAISTELSVKCYLKNNVNKNNMSTSFTKKIDIETQKITFQKGIKFDKIIHFGENEIIFNNDIYENYSVYDTTYNLWSIFSKRSISLYRCVSEKTSK